VYAVFNALQEALSFRAAVDSFLGYPKAPTGTAGGGTHPLLPAGITGHDADLLPNQEQTLWAFPLEERYAFLLPPGTPLLASIDGFFSAGMGE